MPLGTGASLLEETATDELLNVIELIAALLGSTGALDARLEVLDARLEMLDEAGDSLLTAVALELAAARELEDVFVSPPVQAAINSTISDAPIGFTHCIGDLAIDVCSIVIGSYVLPAMNARGTQSAYQLEQIGQTQAMLQLRSVMQVVFIFLKRYDLAL